MYIYNKITKSKKITYYYAENTARSKTGIFIADFSKHPQKDILQGNIYETSIAWVDKKSKQIEWNEDTEKFIDKDIIEHFAIEVL